MIFILWQFAHAQEEIPSSRYKTGLRVGNCVGVAVHCFTYGLIGAIHTNWVAFRLSLSIGGSASIQGYLSPVESANRFFVGVGPGFTFFSFDFYPQNDFVVGYGRTYFVGVDMHIDSLVITPRVGLDVVRYLGYYSGFEFEGNRVTSSISINYAF